MLAPCPRCGCYNHDPSGPWAWRICSAPDCYCLRVNDALGRPVERQHMNRRECPGQSR
jgi:hypothetical protein